MGYFDLNIPYLESDRNVTDKSSLKTRRLKLVHKAMELGYTGVAYNRTLKGVMSESHRCSTTLFNIPKLIPSASSFFAAVKLHRDLLNVAVSSPFRQYTRLTVIVDNASQGSSLNSGNPILRSYDIVAVSPMNQNAFDQACQTSEVDLIAIDFSSSEKLPFKVKQPMVKAAIKRGVYFEITYHGFIADAQSKRQLISNCKLLVDWTRGKNLIFSSAATSATDLRGPLDVSNLFSLLGLNIERAKAAISKNCRSLLANALRKKHFYKEAVKVEEIPPGGQVFDDWLKWDPISSGEGDMPLEDMEKSFALANTVTQNVKKKTINFTSNMNGLPSHGLQLKDVISVTEKKTFAVEKTEEVLDILNSLPENRSVFSTLSKEHESQTSKVLGQHVPGFGEGQSSGDNAKIQFQPSGFEASKMSFLPLYDDSCTKAEETVPVLSDQLYGGNALHDGGRVDITEIKTPIIDNYVSVELTKPFEKPTSSSSASQLEESNVENRRDFGLYRHEDVVVDKVSNRVDSENKQVAGRDKRKRNSPIKPSLFPFKRSLNPKHSKRKSRK